MVESEGLANAIESNLVEAGYRGVDVDVADAEVNHHRLIRCLLTAAHLHLSLSRLPLSLFLLPCQPCVR